ncbi:MAG: T9SS type A sorting domain-containing protein [Flavobacteriaceae bacterium]|nr:T9SS type A sorting domain-containing protein [Flavobacteriaceae bacterium]
MATSDTHVVDLINVAGSTTDLYHAVYDATPGCGALGSALTCSDPNTSTTTGLTVGNTYFVQVYTWTGTSGQTTTFDICIGTPPPPAPGEICSNPIVVSSLPFNTTDDTANYGDDYSGSPGASGCGTTSSYLNGDDVVYAYTASSDTSINVTMSSIGSTYSGIFVYTDCADIGTACIAGEGNSGSSDRSFDVTVTNGTTYYIVISTWASPQSTTYTLDIAENTCTNASVTNTVVDDCASSGGFFINVEVTDMGTATALTVSNSQDATTFPVTIPSTVQFGPYVNGTDIVITVVDDNDANCTQSSNTLTQSVCPPSNDDCSGASVLILETGIADAASATSTASTIEGSTDSGLPAEQCGSFTGTANDDVWYVFEAFTTDVNITVDDGATFIDLVIQAYSGSCGTLTNIGCADGGNPEEVQLSGLTVGEMYYFRVYQYSGSSSTTGKDIDIKLWTSSTLSLDDYQFEGFAYYPNPVTNNLTLRAQKDIQNIAVYNMLGQEVLRTAPNALDSVVDMSALSSSAYFVKVTIDNTSETIRIIKN